MEQKDDSVVFTETGTDDEEEQEEVARVTYVNNILQTFFSKVEVYINNQMIYKSNGLYPHKSYISNNFKAAISDYKGFCIVKAMTLNKILRILVTPYLIPFFTRRMKSLSWPDGFMLYGKLVIDFFSFSLLPYPNMKIRLHLIRARPNFYKISDNPNVSLGIVVCSVYTHRIALKDDSHKKRMDMLAYAPVEYKYWETLTKAIHQTCEKKPIRSIKHFQQCSHSLSRDCNEHKLCLHWFFQWKPLLVWTIWSQTNKSTQKGRANGSFWYCWQLSSICDYHESNKLSGRYSLNPHWWFWRSLSTGVWLDFNARRYWKLSLCCTCSRTTGTGTIFYPTSWKRYWTHCIGWTIAVRCTWQVWCCWKECLKMDNFALQQIINRILLLKFRYLGSFPSDYVSTLHKDNFAIINTQPNNMQGEHWTMIANFRHEFYFTDSLGCKKFSFLKQVYK